MNNDDYYRAQEAQRRRDEEQRQQEQRRLDDQRRADDRRRQEQLDWEQRKRDDEAMYLRRRAEERLNQEQHEKKLQDKMSNARSAEEKERLRHEHAEWQKEQERIQVTITQSYQSYSDHVHSDSQPITRREVTTLTENPMGEAYGGLLLLVFYALILSIIFSPFSLFVTHFPMYSMMDGLAGKLAKSLVTNYYDAYSPIYWAAENGLHSFSGKWYPLVLIVIVLVLGSIFLSLYIKILVAKNKLISYPARLVALVYVFVFLGVPGVHLYKREFSRIEFYPVVRHNISLSQYPDYYLNPKIEVPIKSKKGKVR